VLHPPKEFVNGRPVLRLGPSLLVVAPPGPPDQRRVGFVLEALWHRVGGACAHKVRSQAFSSKTPSHNCFCIMSCQHVISAVLAGQFLNKTNTASGGAYRIASTSCYSVRDTLADIVVHFLPRLRANPKNTSHHSHHRNSLKCMRSKRQQKIISLSLKGC
jgi:hypothetical protein